MLKRCDGLGGHVIANVVIGAGGNTGLYDTHGLTALRALDPPNIKIRPPLLVVVVPIMLGHF